MLSARSGESYTGLGCEGGDTSGKRYDDDRRAGTIRQAGGPRPVSRCADIVNPRLYPLLETVACIVKNRSWPD